MTDPAAKPLDHSEDLLMLGSTGVRTDVQLVVERDCLSSEPLTRSTDQVDEDNPVGLDIGCD